MADDEIPDKFAKIIDYCHYSSSQDEIFTNSSFAREIEVVSVEEAKSTVEGKSGGSLMKSKGGYDNEEIESGEYIAICAGCEERENLGFRKRSLIDGGFDGNVNLDERIEVGSEGFGEKEGESSLKKIRVSLNSEEIEKARVVISDLKVQMVNPLNSVALEGGQCSEKLGSEDGNEEQAEACVENPAKKKVKFEGVDGNGEENRDNDRVERGSSNENREGDLNGSDNVKGGVSHGTKMQGKRELPKSLLGHVCDTTVVDDERGGNGVDASSTRKDGLDEAKDDANEKEKPKGNRTVGNLFDMLRILAIESRYSDVEINIFETAKRRGMTFPQSRFRKDMN